MQFSAIAFDLDGTLYPNYRLYIRLVPLIIKEIRHLLAFGKARNRLRREINEGTLEHGLESQSFYHRQAHYMAEILKKDPSLLEEKTEKNIYRGWEPLFKKVRLFPHVKETLIAFREMGLKLGILSDFPPEKKIENLGLGGCWDAMLCSERIGQLKPGPLPFRELCKVLSLPPEKILYVGNSFTYDILGAQKAGMKAAWIIAKRKYLHAKKREKADFVFYDYRQLSSFVIT